MPGTTVQTLRLLDMKTWRSWAKSNRCQPVPYPPTRQTTPKAYLELGQFNIHCWFLARPQGCDRSKAQWWYMIRRFDFHLAVLVTLTGFGPHHREVAMVTIIEQFLRGAEPCCVTTRWGQRSWPQSMGNFMTFHDSHNAIRWIKT